MSKTRCGAFRQSSKLTATPIPPVIKEPAIDSNVQVFCSGKIIVKVNNKIPDKIKSKDKIKFKFFIMENWQEIVYINDCGKKFAIERDEETGHLFVFEIAQDMLIFKHEINDPESFLATFMISPYIKIVSIK